MSSKGILYVATGARFLKEAIRSASSVRAYMPDIPITLFTDQIEFAQKHFASVLKIDSPQFSQRDKIEPLLHSPYDQTLFLDTDTYICRNCEDIFNLLDRFEMAAAHAPARVRADIPGCPDCFPELNTGVIAYVRSPNVIHMINQWKKAYDEQLQNNPKHRSDQRSFRKELYGSDVKFCVLPPEYNYRINFPGFVGGHADVKIIHGRRINVSDDASRLNASNKIRVFLPGLSLDRRSFFGILSAPGYVLSSVLIFLMRLSDKISRKPKKKARKA